MPHISLAHLRAPSRMDAHPHAPTRGRIFGSNPVERAASNVRSLRSRKLWFALHSPMHCALTVRTTNARTGQRFPSQEVISHARVPTLMPGGALTRACAGHRAAFTGVRRPGSAALSLPPRALTLVGVRESPLQSTRAGGRRSVGARGRHTKMAATRKVFGRTRALALVGKARQTIESPGCWRTLRACTTGERRGPRAPSRCSPRRLAAPPAQTRELVASNSRHWAGPLGA